MCTAYVIEVETDEAVYWWAFASFHSRFRSLYLALFVPLSRNFRRLESRENAYS